MEIMAESSQKLSNPLKNENGSSVRETMNMIKKKLNCNLCENNFISMFGLNIHMKSHPEVVFFSLQLLDDECNNRGDLSVQESEEAETSTPTESITPVQGDPPPRKSQRKVKMKHEFDDSNFTYEMPKKKSYRKNKPPKIVPSAHKKPKRRRGRPPKILKLEETEPSVAVKEELVCDGEASAQDNVADNKDKKLFTCSKCSKQFHSWNGLYLHLKKHNGNYKLRCDKCGKGFHSNFHLDQHMNSHNKLKPFTCSTCGKKFASKQKTKLHEEKCDPNRPKHVPQYLKAPEQTPCHFCGKIFLRPDSLKSHITVQHTEGGKTRFKCDKCGRRFSQKGALKIHQMNPRACLRILSVSDAPAEEQFDEGVKPNAQSMCLTDDVMELLKQDVDDKKLYKCGECGKACVTVDGLEMHKRKHTDKYPFRCDECGKGFNSSVLLEGHLNGHKGTKPHVCNKCGKGFYHVSNQQRHYRYCDPEKQQTKSRKLVEETTHICAFCGKLLQTAGGLQLHMNKHTGKFPFNCTKCNKGYNSNMLLKAHMDSHLNVKGFVCQHCGGKFRHKSNLNRHITYCGPNKQGGEDQRFACDLCGKTYRRKESLAEHKLSKHSSKKFECTICGKAYDSRGSLFWHRTKSLCAKGPPGNNVTEDIKPTIWNVQETQQHIQQQPEHAAPLPVPPSQQQQQQQQQIEQQQIPHDVIIEYPTAPQETLVASRDVYDPQQQLTVSSGEAASIPLEAGQVSSLSVLQSLTPSQDLQNENKNLITLNNVPYPNVPQRTFYFT